MNPESRSCQNCKNTFTIEPDDFGFYAKIGVPPPTFCPQCRMQRRFGWRNERVLHRNTCAKTGKPLISAFAPESGVPVYERDLWWGDSWNPLDFGMDYDFSKPFFVQFAELLKRVPMPAVFNTRTTNCEYASYVGEMKDAYLVSASWGGENLAYCSRTNFSRDSMDLFGATHSELCYECINITKCARLRYSQNCEGCNDSSFLFECRGCTDCFGCTNLRNKSYYIFNTPYSREEYQAKIQSMKLDTESGMRAAQQQFETLKQQSIRKFAALVNCQNVVGDNDQNTANCFMCFDIAGGTKDCKYMQNGADGLNDSYDGYGVGAQCELLYEALDTGVQGQKECFAATVYACNNAYYCINSHSSSNLFGCIGVRQKEYCIFNRQYSKEEFERLRARIVAHMAEMPYVDARGRRYGFGEFFPMELSPFAYNETVANDYFPLPKEGIQKEGYRFRDPDSSPHTPTIGAADLPNALADTTEIVTKDIIACNTCSRVYRIIPKELQFLKRFSLPLPRECPECRHLRRFRMRNPLTVWHRRCMCSGEKSEMRNEKLGQHRNTVIHSHQNSPCPNEFETSYAPERPEIIYCEACYNAEVV